MSLRQIWTNSIQSGRHYSSINEVSVALRPFFFTVHPDRYARHPEIQRQNEKSLQIFNGYINDLFPISPSLKPTKVSFSIPDQKETDTFRAIQISLSGTDPLVIVRAALESCELNVKDLKSSNKGYVSPFNSSKDRPLDERYTTSNVDDDLLRVYLKKKRQPVNNNLLDSLALQRENAVRKSNDAKRNKISMKEEIDYLKNRTGLKDVKWQMDWAESHMKRCVLNIHRFLDNAEKEGNDAISQALFKNILRFGRGSYTCCDGSIQLGADHVPEQWEHACTEHQTRKNQIPQLKEYKQQLEATFGGGKILMPVHRGLAQTLTQFQTLIVRIWRKEAILLRLAAAASDTMIEIVTSYDELAIGTDGRVYIPCNVDVSTLVVFLEENAKNATEINHRMQALMNELEYSKTECIDSLKLKNLKWDNMFSPEALLQSVNRLKNASDDIKNAIFGLSVHISSNPTITVTNDGTISIPINWS